MWTRRAIITNTGIAALAAPTGAFAGMAVRDNGGTGGIRTGRRPLAVTYVPTVSHFDGTVAATLQRGEVLVLKRDLAREFDRSAVAVETGNGSRLGYLPPMHTEIIAGLMDAGIALAASVHSVSGAADRPSVRIRLDLLSQDTGSARV